MANVRSYSTVVAGKDGDRYDIPAGVAFNPAEHGIKLDEVEDKIRRQLFEPTDEPAVWKRGQKAPEGGAVVRGVSEPAPRQVDESEGRPPVEVTEEAPAPATRTNRR